MFRFTIRDVLWLTVVMGLVGGWVVDRRQIDAEKARHRERAIEKEIALYHVRDALDFPCESLDFKELKKLMNEAIMK